MLVTNRGKVWQLKWAKRGKSHEKEGLNYLGGGGGGVKWYSYGDTTLVRNVDRVGRRDKDQFVGWHVSPQGVKPAIQMGNRVLILSHRHSFSATFLLGSNKFLQIIFVFFFRCFVEFQNLSAIPLQLGVESFHTASVAVYLFVVIIFIICVILMRMNGDANRQRARTIY